MALVEDRGDFSCESTLSCECWPCLFNHFLVYVSLTVMVLKIGLLWVHVSVLAIVFHDGLTMFFPINA